MANNFEMFSRLRDVLADLPSVAQPLPELIDEHRIERELKKLDKMMKSREFLKKPNEFKGYYHEFTELIVQIQVAMFNRDIEDWTPSSLADAMTEVIPLLGIADDWYVLDQLDDVMADIIYYITVHKLVRNSESFMEEYFEILSERRMALNYDFGSRSFLKHQFKLDPVQLSRDDMDILFIDNVSSELFNDVEEFLAQQSRRHNVSQMQILYLFLTEVPWNLTDVIATTNNMHFTEFNSNFNSLVRPFLIHMTVDSFINVAKAFHNFVKFLNKEGWLDDVRYREVLKRGNELLFVNFYALRLFNKGIIKDSSDIENKVFNGPNHTINVQNARKYLNTVNEDGLDNESAISATLKLKNTLDEHQLDLEMAQAKTNLYTFLNERLSDQELIPDTDRELFFNIILSIHKRMVRVYNRRLAKWTEASLTECLNLMYAEINLLDGKPTFLRFFDIYLQYLNEIEKIKDWDGMHQAIVSSKSNYFINAINRLSVTNK